MCREENIWGNKDKQLLAVSVDAEKPNDGRIKSGKYIKETQK